MLTVNFVVALASQPHFVFASTCSSSVCNKVSATPWKVPRGQCQIFFFFWKVGRFTPHYMDAWTQQQTITHAWQNTARCVHRQGICYSIPMLCGRVCSWQNWKVWEWLHMRTRSFSQECLSRTFGFSLAVVRPGIRVYTGVLAHWALAWGKLLAVAQTCLFKIIPLQLLLALLPRNRELCVLCIRLVAHSVQEKGFTWLSYHCTHPKIVSRTLSRSSRGDQFLPPACTEVMQEES